MTHLNIAFADVPACAASPCTASDDMTFSTGDDGDLAEEVGVFLESLHEDDLLDDDATLGILRA